LESFFKSCDRLRILDGVLWSGADVREAELLQNPPQAHFRQIDAEALTQNTLQIDAAPAHDAVRLRVGTGLDQLLERLLLILRELRRSPGRFDVDQPLRTVLVKTVYPVPQRLPVHAPDPRRLGAVHPVMNRSQRQQPTGLPDAFSPCCKRPQLIRSEILP
jgi:hypothetical protein